jgi:predicted PurR-regulated permease PerM
MSASPSADRQAAQARSAAAWADLRGRLATVTPAALGRAILGLVVILSVAGVAIGTWPALLPFVIGGLLAYAVLPVVDALDRVMPRSLAAIVSMLAVIAAVIGIFVVVIPPLTGAIVSLAEVVPDPGAIRASLDDLLAGMPQDAKAILGPILIELAGAVANGMAGASSGIDRFLPMVFQAALGVAGAILGLVVLPAWMLTIMTDKRHGAAAVDRRLAAWIRPDFWAFVRMADRAAGTYLRGFVVVAFLIGLLTYLGLNLTPRLGGPVFRADLALATFAGAVQVIPELGPILGFFPALLLLADDPQKAVIYVAIYVAARWSAGATIGGRLLEDRLRVHPAVLIPGVVVLSQVGPLALLLSAPILSFGSDLVRYLHGRLSEPPRPAGLLPGEPLPASRVTATQRRLPAIYRTTTRRSAAVLATGATGVTGPATMATPPTTPSSSPAPSR